jgi:threonine dehydratase
VNDVSAPSAVTYADIEAAARRLEGVAHRTPVATSRQVDALAGCRA